MATVSFVRPPRSDYNLGWDCFIGGKVPPHAASRAFIDGYNNARKAAIRFAGSMNDHQEMMALAGVKAQVMSRVVTVKKEKYRTDKDRGETDRLRGARYKQMLQFTAHFNNAH